MHSDWEQHYREGHMPWDKGQAAPPLLEYLERHEPPVGRILVPGCGLGHDVRALAQASPGSEVIGLDISPTAVSKAKEMAAVGRETYVEGDLFALPEEWSGSFDAFWEHTCFCAIDPGMRDAYVAAVTGLLRPGGIFFAVFYLDPYDDEHQAGDGPPHGVTAEELDARFGRDFVIEDRWTPTRSYAGREGCEEVRRYRRK
ncbi:MAG: methyltransferase domain-containing protein [Verrucomicrobiales bacterium]|nr:methyltransferase domain-containing protein [Verrucomicrobiae bacterium]MCP5554653.1 methyltransferase domain-containing protein [Akkermansiaceae bacterium]